MKNFIILFTEKEGTSPLVHLLDRFHNVSILHQTENLGWEPFDRHNCGPMTTDNLVKCLDYIYRADPIIMDDINHVYMKTATRALESIDNKNAVGFKMRLRVIRKNPIQRYLASIPGVGRALAALINTRAHNAYVQKVISVLKKHDVQIFVAVRQDIFRWALSKYHGDGTGKPGHIQFRVASGAIKRDQIPNIHVDSQKFRALVNECESIIDSKISLIKSLQGEGLQVSPIYYEDFCNDKYEYFHHFFKILQMPVTDEDISKALESGATLKKVHSDDISTFVKNHEEIERDFGKCFVDFEKRSAGIL